MKIHKKRLALIALLCTFVSTYAQSENVVDRNTLYSFEGKGTDSIGTSAVLRFSSLRLMGANTEGIQLNNNEIKVGKTGIYKFSILSDPSSNSILNYAFFLNGKYAFESKDEQWDASKEYKIQIQLKEGDRLYFLPVENTNEDVKKPSFVGNNRLTIQFTDPHLITYPTHEH